MTVKLLSNGIKGLIIYSRRIAVHSRTVWLPITLQHAWSTFIDFFCDLFCFAVRLIASIGIRLMHRKLIHFNLHRSATDYLFFYAINHHNQLMSNIGYFDQFHFRSNANHISRLAPRISTFAFLQWPCLKSVQSNFEQGSRIVRTHISIRSCTCSCASCTNRKRSVTYQYANDIGIIDWYLSP